MTDPDPQARQFLPAALEVVETPASPLGRWTGLTLCGFFALAVLWSFASTVDVVAVAQGRIVPSGEVKIVQSPELAKVAAIHVRNGQAVAAGAVLVELEATDARSDVLRLERELLEAQLDTQRQQAVLVQMDAAETAAPAPPAANDSFAPPAGAGADLVQRHRRLMDSVLAEHAAAVAALQGDLKRTEAERRTLQAEIARTDAILPLLRHRAEARTALAERGNAPALQVIDDRQALLTAEHDRLVATSRLDELDARSQSLTQSLVRTRAEFAARQSELLVDAARRAEAAAQELAKAKERLVRRTLTSPVAGTVEQLAVHTVGGMVDEAQALMAVVPQDARLEVEARIENKDVGFVAAGQRVALKLETFPFTRYGLLEGTVERISRDAVGEPPQPPSEERRQSLAQEQPGALYSARITLPQEFMHIDGHDVPLTPGMAITAEIKTAERRVADYILSPIAKSVQESARER